MQIFSFTKQDQAITKAFMEVIYKEMGWIPTPEDGLDDIGTLFHLPTNGFLFIAKYNDEVIATGGCIKLNEKEYLLKRFYIKEDLRGKGLAQQLFAKIISAVKELHASKIVLDVSKNNSRAIRFYEKNGFERYHQKPLAGWPESSAPDTHDYYFLNIEK